MRRNLNVAFDPASVETLQALRFEPRRSVGASGEPNLDGEMSAAVYVGVGRTCAARRSVRRRRAINFKFVVAPAASAGVIGPVCGTDRAVRRTIEFVAPVGSPRHAAG